MFTIRAPVLLSVIVKVARVTAALRKALRFVRHLVAEKSIHMPAGRGGQPIEPRSNLPSRQFVTLLQNVSRSAACIVRGLPADWMVPVFGALTKATGRGKFA